jgi:hypothetical protein
MAGSDLIALQVGNIIAQTQAGPAEVAVLVDRDFCSSKYADRRDPVAEAWRNLAHALPGIHTEAFATEVSILEKAGSAPTIAILVITILSACTSRPGKRDHQNQTPEIIQKFHDAPPEGQNTLENRVNFLPVYRGKYRGRPPLK